MALRADNSLEEQAALSGYEKLEALFSQYLKIGPPQNNGVWEEILEFVRAGESGIIEDRCLINSIAGESDDLAVSFFENSTEENKQKIMAWRDVHWRDDTVLIYASIYKKDKFIASMLEAGCGPDVKNSVGRTAIYYAAKMNNVETMKLLSRYGACPNQVDNLGWTPLMQICFDGNRATIQAIQSLLDLGANTHCKDEDHKSAIDLAKDMDFDAAIDLIVRHNVKMEASQIDSETPQVFRNTARRRI